MIKYIFISILLFSLKSICYSDEIKSSEHSTITASKILQQKIEEKPKTAEKALAEKKLLEAKKDAATQKTLDERVNQDCANDAKVMDCNKMIIGKGLLKCLNDFMEANKDFVYTKKCDLALEKRKKFRFNVMGKNPGLKKEMIEP